MTDIFNTLNLPKLKAVGSHNVAKQSKLIVDALNVASEGTQRMTIVYLDPKETLEDDVMRKLKELGISYKQELLLNDASSAPHTNVLTLRW